MLHTHTPHTHAYITYILIGSGVLLLLANLKMKRSRERCSGGRWREGGGGLGEPEATEVTLTSRDPMMGTLHRRS